MKPFWAYAKSSLDTTKSSGEKIWVTGKDKDTNWVFGKIDGQGKEKAFHPGRWQFIKI